MSGEEHNNKITVKQLIDLIDYNGDGNVRIQVCTSDGDWEDFDEVRSCSSFLDAIENCTVNEFEAIDNNVIRIDIDWTEFCKGDKDD